MAEAVPEAQPGQRLEYERVRGHGRALAVLLSGIVASILPAAAQTLPSTGTLAVPTYESAGLYWQSPGTMAECQVRFRRAGTPAWIPALALWYDSRDDQCRGSLVHLAPNTSYEVELNLPGQPATRALTFRTWPNQRPILKTITVPSGNATLNAAEGGSPSGYVVYQGAPGAVLDGQNAAVNNITINASYVIVRGLTLVGARQDAIRIANNVTDVVIEDNDVSGWGRTRDGTWGVDLDSGIRAVCTPSRLLERVTIQRNRIHSPRFGSNSWSDGHPAGPQAIAFSHCGGNHVIRHNEIYTTNGNYFNDAIGGEDNFTKAGFPNSDSDVYGNRISHAWDDGIEAEGANENVRIWGNYIDRTAVGIATTITSVGPAYIFRNVWNRSQKLQKVPLDQDDRQPFFKSGSDLAIGAGRRYVFHNTMLQAVQAGLAYTLGGGFGMGGTGPTQFIHNTVSRNNIFHLWRPGASAYFQTSASNDIGWEMYSGTPGDATIVAGINAAPTYLPGHGWQSEAGGNYQLAPGTPGSDAGARIANFNDEYNGTAPDIGAHEGGAAPMRFGIAASSGPAVARSSQITGLSTRMQVLTGDDVLIGGFIVGGGGPKTVIVRARGPSVGSFGIAGSLANPTLELIRASDGTVVATNDDWTAAANAAAIGASGFAPAHPQESAILMALAPGAYTAIVRGVDGATGVGIVEVYEIDQPEVALTGISTRGRVLPGDGVMIGGFVIEGSGPQTVIVRARGPSLASAGVAGALGNPLLQLVRASDGTTIGINDNWGDAGNAAQITASGFVPGHALDSAILVALDPGAYTAVVSGVANGTGVAIVEVFVTSP